MRYSSPFQVRRLLVALMSAYLGYLLTTVFVKGFDPNAFQFSEFLNLFWVVSNGCTIFGSLFVAESLICLVILGIKRLPNYCFLAPTFFFGSYWFVFTGIWGAGRPFDLNNLFVYVVPIVGVVPLLLMLRLKSGSEPAV